MNRDNEIRAALDRAREIISADPSRATGTVSLKLEMGEAIKCITKADGWTVEIDEPTSMGGDNAAPGPYIYGFSAIASCFAMSLRMAAVQAGIMVEAISVDVEGDYDDRAFFDLADGRTGYTNVRLKVDVTSDAENDRIEALIAEARRKSPWLNTFSHQNTIETELVNSGAV
jgi:uncharacterized OsmC-like protein